MRMEQLEYLVAIAQSKSMNDASRLHHISQQSMSAAIKSLENEIGMPLLKRTYYGVTLTPAGEELLRFAQKTLNEYHKTRDTLDRLNQNQAPYQSLRQLTIYTNITYTFGILNPVLNRLYNMAPHISTDVYTYATEQIVEKMIQQAHSTIGLVNFIGEHSYKAFCSSLPQCQLDLLPLRESQVSCYVANTASLAQTTQVSMKTILKYPLVLLSHSDNRFKDNVIHGLSAYGQAHFAMVTSSYEVWINAVQNNIGIGVILDMVPYSNLSKKGDFETLIPLNIKEPMDSSYHCCIYAKEPSAEAALFLQILKNELAI